MKQARQWVLQLDDDGDGSFQIPVYKVLEETPTTLTLEGSYGNKLFLDKARDVNVLRFPTKKQAEGFRATHFDKMFKKVDDLRDKAGSIEISIMEKFHKFQDKQNGEE